MQVPVAHVPVKSSFSVEPEEQEEKSDPWPSISLHVGLESQQSDAKQVSVTQLVMRENIYSLNDYGGNKSVVIAKGATCNHVTVEDEINGYQGSDEKDAHVLETHVKKSLHLQGTSTVYMAIVE